MRTVVVASGKGGVGKTTVAAGLVPFLPAPVLADADVDASNLPLLFRAEPVRSRPFFGGRRATLRAELCVGCLACVEACRFRAMLPPLRTDEAPRVDPLSCEGCAVCRSVCPSGAIEMEDAVTGRWFVSRTPFGPMVHARLGPGADNSGALVERVRREAAREAVEHGRELILVDAPPGIGCPVISAMTGADLVLSVTEPTPSGESDLLRVLDLARHFRIPAAVVVNKADLDAERVARLEARVEAAGAPVVARLPYDDAASAAIAESRLLSSCSRRWHDRFRLLWEGLSPLLDRRGPGNDIHELSGDVPQHGMQGGIT